MATNVRIIHANQFIKAALTGEVDLEASKRVMFEIAGASVSLADFEIILDFRKAHSTLSVTDLWYLAAGLSDFRKTFACRKTAVLCPAEEFSLAEFFALCAQNRGFDVQAFTCFEDAMNWLTVDGT